MTLRAGMERGAVAAFEKLRARWRSLPQWDSLAGSERTATRRVLVIEALGEGNWRAIGAELSQEGITILDAGHLQGANLAHREDGANAILVAHSPKTVCRSFDLVKASPLETKHMVALRLETELPYPVQESLWVFDRLPGDEGDTGATLVLATPAAEVLQAEERLRNGGVRCRGIEFGVAGLAELAVASHADDTLAIVRLDEHDVTFAIAHGGALRYVRYLPGATHSPEATSNLSLAREIEQSIYDYLLRANNGRPTRLVVAGAGAADPARLDALRATLDIPVEPAPCPPDMVGAPGVSIDEAFVEEFSACLGALRALHRRMRGERTAAPPLRAQRSGFEGIDLRGKRVMLVAGIAALFLVWIASLFVVRAAQIHAADRVIQASAFSLGQLEQIQDEVDILQHESRRQRSMLDAILALSEVLPGEIKIEKLSIDPKGTITIRGSTNSVEVASQKAIAALEKSSTFGRPKFLGASEGKNGFSFSLTCELRGAPAPRPEAASHKGKDEAGKEAKEEPQARPESETKKGAEKKEEQGAAESEKDGADTQEKVAAGAKKGDAGKDDREATAESAPAEQKDEERGEK